MRTLLLLLLGTTLHADDWPQWLGPQRDGVWRETGIVEKFPEGGPKVLWRMEIGGGYTGPAIANGKVYLMDLDGTNPTYHNNLKVIEDVALRNGDVISFGEVDLYVEMK